MANTINWFEIPASDFERAKKFYSTILNAEELQTSEMMGIKMAFFPMEGEGVGGALCSGEGYTPSTGGTVPYLNGGKDLTTVLNRVETAGGKVIMPKTKITDEIGYMAFFFDTEGNRIGLHSQN